MPNGDVDRQLAFLSRMALVGSAGALIFTLITISVLTAIALAARSTALRVEEEAVQSHAALCAFRDDLQKSRDTAALYLANHPRGLVGSLGEVLISPEQLRQGIERQTATLNALDSSLVC